MKFTLSWLKDHLDTSATLDEITTKLSSIGLEVEEIDDPGEKLDAFTVARIVDARPHPDADRLQVVMVETEPGGKPLEVVCGAPNARKGLVGVFAPIGTYVPGLDVTLVKRPVRGINSNGMMCSLAELELAEDSEGIIDLDETLGDHVGKPYVDVAGLNDPVIDIAITPNRPDCTGVRGIARDLAAAGLGKLKEPPKACCDSKGAEGTFGSPVKVALKFDKADQDACPVFAGRYIKGVKNSPAPDWMQQRLRAVGLRPINALVDVTNYIAHDLGRPLHVYDADKVKGPVHARLGKSGESFAALDGKTYNVDETMCVIADSNGPLGLGGIIGGESSGATEATTKVLIESAWFDPVRTAVTGRKTGLITDARYRFERGVDPASVQPGLDYATNLIVDICGGEASKAMMAGAVPETDREIAMHSDRVEQLTGVQVTAKQCRDILSALGFGLTGSGKSFKAKVPSWRPDVEGAADLVEEVVRIVGLDQIPLTPLPRASGVAKPVLTPAQKRSRRMRRTLAARGLTEAVTWSFIPQAEAEHFGGGAPELQLANPISVELSTMRPTLIAGLLAAAARNANRGIADQALFEIGQTYSGDAPEDQHVHASGLRTGTETVAGAGRHWQVSGDGVGVFDVKADAAAALAAVGFDIGKAQVTRDAPSWYHPGRSGTIRLGPKRVLAYFGELHPATLKDMDVAAPAAAFEVFLDNLPDEKKRTSRAKPALPAFDLLPVKRDFAFVVDQSVAAGDVVKSASGADKGLITDVNVFDVFEGGSLGEDGKKSIAIEVTLQPKGETLTDKDIEAVSSKIVACVKKATGGDIRA
jgi:phenylalanyl-tRNA synthetase beta chain